MMRKLFSSTPVKKIVVIVLAIAMLAVPVAVASQPDSDRQDPALLGDSGSYVDEVEDTEDTEEIEEIETGENTQDQDKSEEEGAQEGPTLGESSDPEKTPEGDTPDTSPNTPPVLGESDEMLAQKLATPYTDQGTYTMGNFTISQIDARETFGVFGPGDSSSEDGRPLPIKTDREQLWMDTANSLKFRRGFWKGGYGATFYLHDSLTDATTSNGGIPLDDILESQATYRYSLPGYVGTTTEAPNLRSYFVSQGLVSGLYSVKLHKYEKKIDRDWWGNKDPGQRDEFWVLIWWDPDGDLALQTELTLEGGSKQGDVLYNPSQVRANHTVMEGLEVSTEEHRIVLKNENLPNGELELYSGTASAGVPTLIDLEQFYDLPSMHPGDYTVEFTATVEDPWGRQHASTVSKDFTLLKDPVLTVRGLNPTVATVEPAMPGAPEENFTWEIAVNPTSSIIVASGTGKTVPTSAFAALTPSALPGLKVKYQLRMTEKITDTYSITVSQEFAIKKPHPTATIDSKDNPTIIKGFRDQELIPLNEGMDFRWYIIEESSETIVASSTDSTGIIDFSSLDLEAGNYTAFVTEIFEPYVGHASGFGTIKVPFYIGKLEMTFPDLKFGEIGIKSSKQPYALKETATLGIIDNSPATSKKWTLTATLGNLTTPDGASEISADDVYYVENGTKVPFNQVEYFATGVPDGVPKDLSKTWSAGDDQNGFVIDVAPSVLAEPYNGTITWTMSHTP